MITWADIEHFTPEEFACRCGECGSDGTEMNIEFVFKLDQLRERSGRPMHINSGYRCPEYNDRIASTGLDGPHTTGHAVDVRISGETAFHLMQQNTLGGWMQGIGINQKGPHEKRFIHLDDLTGPERPRPRIWSY